MRRVFLHACVACVLVLLALPVQAQEWSAEQTEIWKVTSKQWKSEQAGDGAWMEMLHPSFQSWPLDLPMPVDVDDARRFIAAEAGQSKMLAYDIAPVAIIVTEGTAVAHYYYTVFIEYADGEREMNTGRSTDILTRTEGGWKYVSWVGEERAGEDED